MTLFYYYARTMDIGTHVATGLVLSTFFDTPEQKTACMIGAVVVDISLIPWYAYRFAQLHHWKLWRYERQFTGSAPPFCFQIYHFAHSPVLILLLGIYFFWTQSSVGFAFLVGHISHILWDIPSHTGEWAHRPLYPFSDFRIEGFANWWRDRRLLWCMGVLWIALMIAYIFIL